MSLFLIRDDDANATTDPERLERLYEPLTRAGLPVCYAVVPDVALDAPASDGGRGGFLAADAPTTGTATLGRDTPLAAWLRADPQRRDVLVHGLTHARIDGGYEFAALDASAARERVGKGLAIALAALDRAPRGFVAPWDALSRPALVAALSAYDLVSTGWVDRRKLPPSAWLAHVRERLRRSEALRVGRGWIVRHRGCRLQPTTPPASVERIVDDIGRGARVGVIVLHHWQFWRDGTHPVIAALAQALKGRRVGIVQDALAELDDVPEAARRRPAPAQPDADEAGVHRHTA